jgi:hypothetical protein
MRLAAAVVAIALLMAIPTPGSSQTLLLPSDQNYLGIEFLKPDFTESANTSFATFSLLGTFRYRIDAGLAAVVQMPLSKWDSESQFSDGETAFGNLFLGLQGKDSTSPVFWEVGVWFPTAPEDNQNALLVGFLSDLNRWEAFLSDVISPMIGVGYSKTGVSGTGARLRLAPSIFIPTEDGGDPEVFSFYSGHFTYQGPQAEFLAGLSGRIWLTVDDADLGERTFHQFDLALIFKAQQFRPGLTFLVPLDEGLFGSDIVDFVFGIQLGVALM